VLRSSRRCVSALIAVIVSFSLLGSVNAAVAPPTADERPPTADAPEREPRDLGPDEATDEGPIDHTESWGPSEPTSPTSTPPASSTPSTAPPPPAEPPPPAPDPEYQSKMRSAEGTAIAGYVFVGLGGATLVLLSGTAWIAARVAEDRANDDPILVSEQELHRRAERRMRFARISAIAGGSAVLLGGILIAAGLGSRATLRSQRRNVAIAPLLGPTRGVQLQLRF
jgi:hypothetical protein